MSHQNRQQRRLAERFAAEQKQTVSTSTAAREVIRKEHKISRRTFLGAGLGFLGISALGYFVLRDKVQSQATKASINFIFMRHEFSENAEHLLQALDKASNAGKKYDLMLYESANTSESTFAATATNQKTLEQQLMQKYSQLLDMHVSPEAAQATLRKLLRSGDNVPVQNFHSILAVGMAVRGVHTLPIEINSDSYEPVIISTIGNMGAAMDKLEKAWFEPNCKIADIIKYYSIANKSAIDMSKVREQEIASKINFVISKAIQTYPDLAAKDGQEIRIISYMGAEHIRLLKKITDPNITVSGEVYNPAGTLQIRITSNVGSDRYLNRREQMLSAIGALFFDSTLEDVIYKKSPSIANELSDKAMSLTEAQLDQIDGEASRMGDASGRETFIINKIAGRELLKVSGPSQTITLLF